MTRLEMKSSHIAAAKSILRIAAAVVCLTLLLPAQARASLIDILDTISAIESTITSKIGLALKDIQTVQTGVQTLYKEVLWPVAAIEQAQSFVSRTIQTYRGWMNSVNSLPIASAQLSNPQQFESRFLSGSATSFPQMNTAYTATYGSLPTAQQAPSSRLQIMDINDALAKDALAQSMASDQASKQMLTLADQMESGVSSAAPGSSAYLTASALTATLQTQAFQLQLMASLLREESVQLAHQNARYKQSIGGQNQLNQNLQQMLTTGR
jgi:hypothetical protein